MISFYILIAILCGANAAASDLGIACSEDFTSPNGAWKTGGGLGRSATIVNGVYRIDQRAAFGDLQAESPCFINYDQDFDIDIKVRQITGSASTGFGLMWSGKNSVNTNVFLVTTSGNYRVYSIQNGDLIDIQPWTPVVGIPPMQSWFTITLRKRGSGMSVLLNDQTLFGFEQPAIFGAMAGVVVGPQAVVEFDDFIVKQDTTPIPLADQFATPVKRENLGPQVNCSGGDISPVITADGKRLYFGRYPFVGNVGDPTTEDIWYTDVKPDGTWGPAVNVGQPLNNYSSNFLISITPDRNQVVVGNTYYSNGAPKGAGISTAIMTENGWSVPRDIRIDQYYNNSTYSELSLDPSGMVLLMTVEREDTRGQRDIYVSKRKRDGSFSVPVNCGKTINTWGNEVSPFIAADGVTVFFATDGRRGYGDFDIWMTRRLDDTWTSWSEPVNVGPSINTDGWDAYFTIPAKADYAYLSASNPDNNSLDLYRVPLSQGLKPLPVVLVSGRVLNAATKQPIATTVAYESLTKGTTVGLARSEPRNGQYSIVLPAGDLYGFRAEFEGFYPVSDQLDTRSLNSYGEITRDLYLAPIQKNQTIILNNVFFDFRLSELRPESYAELNRLAEFLIAKPMITIELAGHSDKVGTNAANMEISKSRVQAVRSYLESKGIAANRLKVVAYGSTKPLDNNDTEEGRRRNRRVEFKILSM
jgi:outer membrane protein OmpA-like peptidoglycan-associated protein